MTHSYAACQTYVAGPRSLAAEMTMRHLSTTTEALCWHMSGGAVVYPQGSDFARPSTNLIARQEKPPG